MLSSFGGTSMVSKIGEVLLKIGAITQHQIDDVLSKQQAGNSRLFGEIAIELRYIDDDALASYLDMQKKPD